MSVVDKHIPLTTISLRELKWKKKPWISKGIQKCIRLKNIYYKKFLKSKDLFWYNRYKYYRNSINNSKRLSKQNFYQKFFKENKSNTKKLWKGINDILHNNKQEVNEIRLILNGDIIDDQEKVATHMNNFYVNIAQKLVDDLGNTNSKYQDYLKNPNEHSLFINEIEPDEVYTHLSKLNIYKASDIYGISPKLVKLGANSIHNNLTLIFNKSISLGQFPTAFKIAKVIPIYKSGPKTECCNYRPISLLSIFSKIFEKVMHSRTITFLHKFKILNKRQYGFQKGKSTEFAILDLYSKIVDAFENNERSCCVFLDFAKAFDTVNHNILLSKLNYYGIRGNALSWFKSYLSNRNQCVEVNGKQSSLQHINCGVPQGSVLGPLLFLLYINDINQSSKVIDFFLFADDTSIFCSHKNLKVLEETLNTELVNVSDWLIANKLSLNVDKTNVILFKNKNTNEGQIDLYINDELLKEKDTAKYLGIQLDHKLTWKDQINQINLKLVKSVGILSKIRHYVPLESLKTFYHAFIQSHLDYGALIWGKCAKIHFNKLKASQNNAIRIINFKSRDDSTLPLYKSSKILPLKENLMFLKARFIWRMVHNYLPESIMDIFYSHGAISKMDRLLDINNKKFQLPIQNKEMGIFFIIFDGIKLWNQQIPNDITQINTIKDFKTKYKQFLFDTR